MDSPSSATEAGFKPESCLSGENSAPQPTGGPASDTTTRSSSPPSNQPKGQGCTEEASERATEEETRPDTATPGSPWPNRQAGSMQGSVLKQDVLEKMKAFHLSRQNLATSPHGSADVVPRFTPARSAGSPLSTSPKPSDRMPLSFSPSNLARGNAPLTSRPSDARFPGPRPSASPLPSNSRLDLQPAKGLAAKRGLGMGMKLSDATKMPTDTQNVSSAPDRAASQAAQSHASNSLFNRYAEYVDTEAGMLKFKGQAVVHDQGIDFSGGTSFRISLSEVETLDELGKGNYGTVYKVRHSRPRARKPGQGLGGNKIVSSSHAAAEKSLPTQKHPQTLTGVIMAMKEIRLELDEAKFAAIIMELNILHRCVSPYIIDFFGAFFQEGAVYICMEFMDGGSVDKLYQGGIPENVLRKITLATVKGLKALKDDHNIIHRDVKPTNILMNTRGQVKICDFGVSGNLVASIAKTNIGCQSYMAPERISSGGMSQVGANPGGGTYSVQSDIWSLGLTIIECAMGKYPYPPETYDNIFSQLSAIVDGEPPDLSPDIYSEAARDFVRGALNKIPNLRPTYSMLLRHPWLADIQTTPLPDSDEEGCSAASRDGPIQSDAEVSQWVKGALGKKQHSLRAAKPALHAAPLNAVETKDG